MAWLAGQVVHCTELNERANVPNKVLNFSQRRNIQVTFLAEMRELRKRFFRKGGPSTPSRPAFILFCPISR